MPDTCEGCWRAGTFYHGEHDCCVDHIEYKSSEDPSIEHTYIDITPDGMFLTACGLVDAMHSQGWVILQEYLDENGDERFSDEPVPDGEVMAFLHGALVTRVDLIKKSSWVKPRNG